MIVIKRGKVLKRMTPRHWSGIPKRLNRTMVKDCAFSECATKMERSLKRILKKPSRCSPRRLIKIMQQDSFTLASAIVKVKV